MTYKTADQTLHSKDHSANMETPHTQRFFITAWTAILCMLISCGGGVGSATTINALQTTPTDPILATKPPTTSNDACVGSATAPAGDILYTPVVPKPVKQSDIVGLIIQNTIVQDSTQHIETFGQVFSPGKVQTSDTLSTNITGQDLPVQIDALALWLDGSIKLASVSMTVPSICALSELPLMLSKNVIAKSSIPSIDLAVAKPDLTVNLTFTSGSYTGTRFIDLGAVLQTSLKTNTDYWLRGPLVSQARVDIPIKDNISSPTSTLHLTADISVLSDGTTIADVQFNNDLTTILPKIGKVDPKPALAALSYSASINLNGQQFSQKVTQIQYTNWHVIISSKNTSHLNVQHDIAQLQDNGLILPYDLKTGVANTLLKNYDRNIIQQPTFNSPLSANGITNYMPQTGGRPDIGFLTQFNTVWLLTQDARAAKVALAQSDTSGAIPWNYRLSSGQWMTPEDGTDIWTDSRGGPHGYTSGVANVYDTSVWTIDNAHQPNLNYIPYLMSGARWNLDRLNAQAAANLTIVWPVIRCLTGMCATLINGGDQLRGQAWGFMELKQAAFIGPSTSSQTQYFNKAVSDNWVYVHTMQTKLSAQQGEATGWIPGAYGTAGVTAEWQQDFLTGVVILAGLMGDSDAKQFVAWQEKWLTGRFIGYGMNPYDGCNYNLKVIAADGTFFNTWSDIAKSTADAGMSNGSSWLGSAGYYCPLARSALYGALRLNPSNNLLIQALTWLEDSGAPNLGKIDFQSDPTFNIGNTK